MQLRRSLLLTGFVLANAGSIFTAACSSDTASGDPEPSNDASTGEHDAHAALDAANRNDTGASGDSATDSAKDGGADSTSDARTDGGSDAATEGGEGGGCGAVYNACPVIQGHEADQCGQCDNCIATKCCTQATNCLALVDGGPSECKRFDDCFSGCVADGGPDAAPSCSSSCTLAHLSGSIASISFATCKNGAGTCQNECQ